MLDRATLMSLGAALGEIYAVTLTEPLPPRLAALAPQCYKLVVPVSA